MKKIIMLYIVATIVFALSACNSDKTDFVEADNVSENVKNIETNDLETNANRSFEEGLEFPNYSMKTEYNGYVYELVNEEKSSDNGSSNKYSDTIIYRYEKDGNKQEWYVLDGRPGVMGIFNNGKLIYLQDDGNYDDTVRLKMLDLQTLVTEELFVKDRIKGMFKYDNYIMLLCGGEIIRYDLLQKTKMSIIDADSMGNDCYLEADNVFACNDKIWIVVTNTEHSYGEESKSKVYCSDLNGDNLSYSGISLSCFENIASVNEYKSTFTYNADTGKVDENRYIIYEKRTVSLNDKSEISADKISKDEQISAGANPEAVDMYEEFDSTGVKVEY